MKIGLISHSIYSDNLGCSALAISNLKLMDEVFERNDVPVEYVVILPEYGFEFDVESFVSLKGYTKNKFSYKQYPRPKKLLFCPWLLKTTDAFSDCDYVVDLCGGDGYTDNYGIKRLFAESIPIFGCKWNHVPAYFAPQTIGPFNTKIGKILAKWTLKKLEIIFVRDAMSFECCKQLGFEKKTKLVTDVAFALPFTRKTLNNNLFNIGINISGLLYNGGYTRDNYFNLSFSYKEFIDSLISELLKDENNSIYLVPHVLYSSENVDDDYSVCESIKEKFPQVHLPSRFKTASEAKSFISSMDLFTGARMHSTIGAISSGVPVIPIAYSRKFNGLYSSLKYPYLIDCRADLNVSQAIELFITYLNDLDAMKVCTEQAKEIFEENLKEYQKSLENIYFK